mmetsp:Transcript_10376/g.13772  ORF Transcript_10376/g.13772 Transcript_10376/m.13772 type:complete len:309 (+) Transcript_10376:45-971(+)
MTSSACIQRKARQPGPCTATASEALSQLDLLELLLLQHKGQLGEEDGCCERAVGIDAVDVLQGHLLILLPEAANIRVCGDWVTLLHRLANLDHDLSAREALLHGCRAVCFLDGDLQAVDGCHLAGGRREELIVVAEIALRIDLATSAIATKGKGVLVKIDVLLSVRVRCEYGQDHGLIPGTWDWPGNNNVWLLLAVLSPGKALHLLLQRLGQAVLGRQLPSLWHHSNGTNIHRSLLATGNRLHALLILGWDLNRGLEDCIREHLLRHADIDVLALQVAVGTCQLSSGLLWVGIILLGENRVGHGGVCH